MFESDDRGVSEVLAFVLVFAIIIGSVGLLYVVGFDSMQSYQEAEQLTNAERAMSAMGENVNDVQRAGIEERSSEIELRDGRIGVDANGTTLDISGVGEIETGAIVYQRGSTHISYEAGGVFRGDRFDRNQTVVVDQPTLTCNPDRGTAIVSLLEISGDEGDRAISGDSSVELTVVENRTTTQTVDPGTVTVDVEASPFEAGWEDALDRNGWDDGECPGADSVTIRIVDVGVEF